MDTILVVPKTPERKNTRKTIRRPFVISSSKWRDVEDHSRKQKEEVIEAKKMKKQEKIEKQMKNVEQKKKKMKKKQ